MSDSDDEMPEKHFKIILIGDPSVGKTSVANRYTNDSFTQNSNSTVGIQFYLKRTVLQGNCHVTLKVSWLKMILVKNATIDYPLKLDLGYWRSGN